MRVAGARAARGGAACGAAEHGVVRRLVGVRIEVWEGEACFVDRLACGKEGQQPGHEWCEEFLLLRRRCPTDKPTADPPSFPPEKLGLKKHHTETKKTRQTTTSKLGPAHVGHDPQPRRAARSARQRHRVAARARRADGGAAPASRGGQGAWAGCRHRAGGQDKRPSTRQRQHVHRGQPRRAAPQRGRPCSRRVQRGHHVSRAIQHGASLQRQAGARVVERGQRGAARCRCRVCARGKQRVRGGGGSRRQRGRQRGGSARVRQPGRGAARGGGWGPVVERRGRAVIARPGLVDRRPVPSPTIR